MIALELVTGARHDQHPPERISIRQTLRDRNWQASSGVWLEATGEPLNVIPAAAPIFADPGAG